MRLDFTNFVITGPSTSTASVGKLLWGALVGAGKEVSYRGNCFTDSFKVAGADVPELCGTLTGEHSKYLYIKVV